MMKKLLTILCLAMMPLIAFTSCDSDDGGGTTPREDDLAANIAGSYASAVNIKKGKNTIEEDVACEISFARKENTKAVFSMGELNFDGKKVKIATIVALSGSLTTTGFFAQGTFTEPNTGVVYGYVLRGDVEYKLSSRANTENKNVAGQMLIYNATSGNADDPDYEIIFSGDRGGVINDSADNVVGTYGSVITLHIEGINPSIDIPTFVHLEKTGSNEAKMIIENFRFDTEMEPVDITIHKVELWGTLSAVEFSYGGDIYVPSTGAIHKASMMGMVTSGQNLELELSVHTANLSVDGFGTKGGELPVSLTEYAEGAYTADIAALVKQGTAAAESYDFDDAAVVLKKTKWNTVEMTIKDIYIPLKEGSKAFDLTLEDVKLSGVPGNVVLNYTGEVLETELSSNYLDAVMTEASVENGALAFKLELDYSSSAATRTFNLVLDASGEMTNISDDIAGSYPCDLDVLVGDAEPVQTTATIVMESETANTVKFNLQGFSYEVMGTPIQIPVEVTGVRLTGEPGNIAISYSGTVPVNVGTEVEAQITLSGTVTDSSNLDLDIDIKVMGMSIGVAATGEKE